MLNLDEVAKFDHLSPDAFHVYNLIPSNFDVLFVDYNDPLLIKSLKEQKNCDITLVGRTFFNTDYADFAQAVHPSEPLAVLPDFPHKSFNFIVLGDQLFSVADVELLLTSCIRVAKYVVISFNNFAHYKRRLSFLLRGSYFDFDSSEWHSVLQLRYCNTKEFMRFCCDLDIDIKRAFYHCGDRRLYNLYDVSRVPSLFSHKFFFVLSDGQDGFYEQEMIADGL